MPEITTTLDPRTRQRWRAWLERNGSKKREIWLLLGKKHVEGPRLSYEDAIEEALCFGWVDGITKTFDADHRAIRFTPRNPKSMWSEPNKRRVRQLIREGRMTEAGLALVRAGKKSGAWAAARKREDVSTLPPDLVEALERGPEEARAYFGTLPPSYRKMLLYWIADAKRPETRARRIADVVERSARRERRF